jgi:siroheme decarboxylase
MNARADAPLDAIDRAIVRATQGGLPLDVRPYDAVANGLGLSPADVMARMQRMRDLGVIRRIAAVPNHYRLGYRANGMSVWDVPDDRVGALGELVGALPFVSHCYLRPRVPPVWRYNLFAMVHGATRDEVSVQVREIVAVLGDADRAHEILYSKRILKKTGLRLRAE